MQHRHRFESPAVWPRAGRFLLLATAAAALAACNDSGEDPPAPPPAPTLLQGTAAVGAPLAGARVQVIDADTSTTDPTAVTADAQGRYSIDVSSLKAPLLVRASATLDGETVEQVAVVPALVASSDNTANITPLTTAVAALVAPSYDTTALATAATLASSASADKVASATQLLVNTLASDAQTAAALGSNFNPLSTNFTPNGSGIDAVLETWRLKSVAAVSASPTAPPPSRPKVCPAR